MGCGCDRPKLCENGAAGRMLQRRLTVRSLSRDNNDLVAQLEGRGVNAGKRRACGDRAGAAKESRAKTDRLTVVIAIGSGRLCYVFKLALGPCELCPGWLYACFVAVGPFVWSLQEGLAWSDPAPRSSHVICLHSRTYACSLPVCSSDSGLLPYYPRAY